MLDVLAPLAAERIYVPFEAAARSALDPRDVAARHPGRIAADVATGLDTATGDLVVVAGSIFLVGGARSRLLGLPCDAPVAL
jgi:hypothetical protein